MTTLGETSPLVEDEFTVQAQITKTQSIIKQMKKESEAADLIAAQVAELLRLRAKLAEMKLAQQEPADTFNRRAFDELILRKMYIVPSFEIHNGPSGLFDYGPPACTLKANILALWRQHFVMEESMLEMECTNLTPSVVLETSGHVDRFTDFMVKDEVTGECFRADKLLEDIIDAYLAKPDLVLTSEVQEKHRIIQRQADAFTAEELYDHLMSYGARSPTNPDNAITRPFPFNLMFKTSIGPEGTAVGYLRPETAQGLFVNFRRLLDYNQQRMPFAAAQIGLGFRNEIAPRNGLLRVREFCMAEIEHFVHPDEKQHPKFELIASKELVLFPAENQLGSGRTVTMSIGEAVSSGIVNNQTLGYFMTRTQLWAEKIGINPSKMRFRQHLKTEMAHYAADCWDMEIQLSYGWIECVGHADRACYDLQQHAQKSGVAMVAAKRLDTPLLVNRIVCEPNKQKIGPRYKGDQKAVIAALEGMSEEECAAVQQSLEKDGIATVHGFEISPELVTFKSEKKTISEMKYTPSVIEPSYGIGRLIHSVLEHSFSQREGDENRCVMRFRPCVAPIKIGIYRLINNSDFDPYVSSIHSSLQLAGLVVKVDSSSGTVGRRYARADELGIPFGVTIDFQTLMDESVTVRDRDSMGQIRVPLTSLKELLLMLVHEQIDWSRVLTRYPSVQMAAEEEEVEGGSKKTEEANKEMKKGGSALVVETSLRGSFSRPAAKA